LPESVTPLGAAVEGAPQSLDDLWITSQEAAALARVNVKAIYYAVHHSQIRVAVLGGRSYRYRREWVHEWVESFTKPVEVHRGAALRVVRRQVDEVDS
jgi:excisionase family DNA binding protein